MPCWSPETIPIKMYLFIYLDYKNFLHSSPFLSRTVDVNYTKTQVKTNARKQNGSFFDVAWWILMRSHREYLRVYLSLSRETEGRNAYTILRSDRIVKAVFNGAPPFNTPASREVSCNESTGVEPIVKISDHCPVQWGMAGPGSVGSSNMAHEMYTCTVPVMRVHVQRHRPKIFHASATKET